MPTWPEEEQEAKNYERDQEVEEETEEERDEVEPEPVEEAVDLVVQQKELLRLYQTLANLIRSTVNPDQFEYPYPIPYISEATQTG